MSLDLVPGLAPTVPVARADQTWRRTLRLGLGAGLAGLLALPVLAQDLSITGDARARILAEPGLGLTWTDPPEGLTPLFIMDSRQDLQGPLEHQTQTQAEDELWETGMASYYARQFHGRRTASGERYSNHELMAAHRDLPFGSLVQVRNPDTGQSVVVRVADHGPSRPDRVIDLSWAAAKALGLLQRGVAPVEIRTLRRGRDESTP